MHYIRFVTSPTERTTAATDVLLAVLAVVAVIFLSQIGANDVRKTLLWMSIYAMLALAAAFGAIVHGIVLPRTVHQVLWAMLYLLLGQIIVFIGAAAVYEFWGWRVTLTIFPSLVMAGLVFFVVAVFWAASFIAFIGFQLLVMLFALGVYLWLSLSEALPGAWWIVGGILGTIAASALQTRSSVRVVIIWEFDHNGIYHLVQAVGLVLLFIGLWLGLASG